MHLPEDAVLLRILLAKVIVASIDRWYEAIVLKARELELAGATRAARTNGLWKIKSSAHRENPLLVPWIFRL